MASKAEATVETQELELTRAVALAAVRRVQGVAWANHDLAEALRRYVEWRQANGLPTDVWEVPE
jgi:hypothetical protein